MFILRTFAAATVIAVLTISPLAACSSSDDSGSSKTESSSSSKPAPTPVAQIDNVTGRSTAVALDKGFTDALTSLGLVPGVVGTAALADGSVSFPITGGNVKYYTPGSIQPYVQGILHHDGSGLSLTAGPTVVELKNFNVDPGTSKLMGDVVVNGAVAAPQAVLFDLDGSTLKPLQTGPDATAILTGTRVLISTDAAGLLNQTFKTDAVKPGLLVGVATITLNTK